eukprot:gene9502-9665_t
MEDGLATALRAAPRLFGQIELTAYDYALRRLMVMQHVRFTGVLPTESLEAGLLRALQQYPVLLGQLRRTRNNTASVCWDSHGKCNALGFHWSKAVKSGQPPNLWSNWDIWCSGAALPVFGFTAAAKVLINCLAGLWKVLQRAVYGAKPDKKVVGLAGKSGGGVLSLAVVAILLASVSMAAAWAS